MVTTSNHFSMLSFLTVAIVSTIMISIVNGTSFVMLDEEGIALAGEGRENQQPNSSSHVLCYKWFTDPNSFYMDVFVSVEDKITIFHSSAEQLCLNLQIHIECVSILYIVTYVQKLHNYHYLVIVCMVSFQPVTLFRDFLQTESSIFHCTLDGVISVTIWALCKRLIIGD